MFHTNLVLAHNYHAIKNDNAVKNKNLNIFIVVFGLLFIKYIDSMHLYKLSLETPALQWRTGCCISLPYKLIAKYYNYNSIATQT